MADDKGHLLRNRFSHCYLGALNGHSYEDQALKDNTHSKK